MKRIIKGSQSLPAAFHFEPLVSDIQDNLSKGKVPPSEERHIITNLFEDEALDIMGDIFGYAGFSLDDAAIEVLRSYDSDDGYANLHFHIEGILYTQDIPKRLFNAAAKKAEKSLEAAGFDTVEVRRYEDSLNNLPNCYDVTIDADKLRVGKL